MAGRRVIVDGSNLATEGRTMPSLEQLDQAVREFIAENPSDDVTVVVDASFSHRIDPSEVPAFEAAEAAGEVVSPPAGAIGRGDAFLLRIAEKIGATVLSNDSFQEFHGEHTWLFDKGRLIGGKPVPGIGWIFMERNPVRGAKSREVVKEAKRRKKAETDVVDARVPPAEPSGPRTRPKVVDRAIARATKEVVEAKPSPKARRRGGQPPSEPVNEPLAFITFIAAHPLGTEVLGTVAEYSSHGAFIDADGARCYVPLSAMADPPPRKAREVLAKNELRPYTVQAFDPQRRGIELAVPGFARVAGGPTAETVEAETGAALPELDAEVTLGHDESSSEELDLGGEPVGGGRQAAPRKWASKAIVKSAEAEKKPAAKRTAAKKTAATPATAGTDSAGTESSTESAPGSEAPAAAKATRTRKAPARKAPAAHAAVVPVEPGATPAKATRKRAAATLTADEPEGAQTAEAAATLTADEPEGAQTAEAAAPATTRKATARKATARKRTSGEADLPSEAGVPLEAASSEAPPSEAAPSKAAPSKAAPKKAAAKKTPAKTAAAPKTASRRAAAEADRPSASKAAATRKAAPAKAAAAAPGSPVAKRSRPRKATGGADEAAG